MLARGSLTLRAMLAKRRPRRRDNRVPPHYDGHIRTDRFAIGLGTIRPGAGETWKELGLQKERKVLSEAMTPNGLYEPGLTWTTNVVVIVTICYGGTLGPRGQYS
jgi:hypothetical protein